MDAHEFAHSVALFMQKQFQYSLACATEGPFVPPKPPVPKDIDPLLLEASSFAVKMCVDAFTNPSECLLRV